MSLSRLEKKALWLLRLRPSGNWTSERWLQLAAGQGEKQLPLLCRSVHPGVLPQTALVSVRVKGGSLELTLGIHCPLKSLGCISKTRQVSRCCDRDDVCHSGTGISINCCLQFDVVFSQLGNAEHFYYKP